MFDTLGSFSTVYFILATIFILLVLFEKQCLQLEAKFDAKVRKMKRAKAQKAKIKSTQQNRQKQVSVKAKHSPRVYKNPGSSAA